MNGASVSLEVSQKAGLGGVQVGDDPLQYLLLVPKVSAVPVDRHGKEEA